MSWLELSTVGSVLVVLASCSSILDEEDDFVCADSAVPPFTTDWESLALHEEAPEWFRDAKFGIYFHWGVYSVPAFGSEWYPRNMHQKNNRVYAHHVETYGDPAEYGYDRFVPMFGAEKFDAEEWVDLFEKAGAQFAGPVAEHHDGFAMWDSELTPWNAKDRGPKRDITGELAAALRKRGMKLVTSFHHARNSLWEKDGKWTGHYDGAKRDFPSVLEDPERAVLYGYVPREEFLAMWLGKLKEVIDSYQPDLMWFDSWLHEIPEEIRQEYLAYYFNRAREWNKDVVVTFKQQDFPRTVAVDDYEKGRADRLTEFTWLTDDTISRGSWCYTQDLRIKPTAEVVHVLIDIVSKNGQLLLNISPKADGTIPDEQKNVLLGLGEWLDVNGEAIYETRPWVIFGEGPTRMKKGGHFVGSLTYTAQDVRFTTRGDTLYAIFLGKPGRTATIASLAAGTGLYGGRVHMVSLLGGEPVLYYSQDAEGLHVVFPDDLPSEHATAIRIEGLRLEEYDAAVVEGLAGGWWGKEKEPTVVGFHEGKAVLNAEDAILVGSLSTETKDGGKTNIGFWDNPADHAAWKVEVPAAGTYEVVGRFAALEAGAFRIAVAGASLEGKSPVTGAWDRFETVSLGTIEIGEAGVHSVKITPVADAWSAINLTFLELRR